MNNRVMNIVLTSDEAEAAIYALCLRYVHATGRNGGNSQANLVLATAEQIEETAIRELGWSRFSESRVERWINGVMKRVTMQAYDLPKRRV